MTTNYSCEPTWHDGAVVDADWFLMEREDQNVTERRGFAVCSEHLSRAADWMVRHDIRTFICRRENLDILGS